MAAGGGAGDISYLKRLGESESMAGQPWIGSKERKICFCGDSSSLLFGDHRLVMRATIKAVSSLALRSRISCYFSLPTHFTPAFTY